MISLYNGWLQTAGFKIKWKLMFVYIREMGFESYVTAKNGFASLRSRTEDTFLRFLVYRTGLQA